METQVATSKFCMKFFLLIIDCVKKNILIMWTLAHIGIVGNEWSDRLTKEAIKKVDVDIQIPLSKSEGTSIVWKESKNLWKMQ